MSYQNSQFQCLFALTLGLFLYGCDSGDTGSSPDEATLAEENVNQTQQTLDQKLRDLIINNQLTGDPSIGRNIPDIQSSLAQLGKKLFFTKSLGGQYDSACVTCHHPLLGGGDGLSLPIGVDAELPDLLGPGRMHQSNATGFDGGPTVPRNSPSTFNAALWDSVMFWDGRVESIGKTTGANGNDGQGIRTPESPFDTVDVNAGENLPQAQARFPVTSEEEMKGFVFEDGSENDNVRRHLAERIGGYGTASLELVYNNWLEEFQASFNSVQDADILITFDRITDAISAYERSQVFIDNQWKIYVKGDLEALSEASKRGALLFFTSVDDGGAGCSVCHSGDFFTDEQHHVIGTVQVGRGKGNGNTGDADFGRFNVTGELEDLYAFRTPTLLNVEVTGPWGHAGAYADLHTITKYHLNPRQSLSNFDFSSLDSGVQTVNALANTLAAVDRIDELRIMGIEEIRDVDLNPGQINDIVQFLLSLTDPCVKDPICLSPWVPDANETPPDSFQLRALVELTSNP